MAAKSIREGFKQVKPILSADKTEARRRVLNLYKAWYRHIPYVVKEFDVPITVPQGREKLREQFTKNKHVADIRAVDVLVIKGQMDLVETMNIWKQKTHIMHYFQQTTNPKPTDFLSKFYEGYD